MVKFNKRYTFDYIIYRLLSNHIPYNSINYIQYKKLIILIMSLRTYL